MEEKRANVTDTDEVVRHLQIIYVWASVGKDPIYHGIEAKSCAKVEMWTEDAILLIQALDAKARELEVMKAKLREIAAELEGEV